MSNEQAYANIIGTHRIFQTAFCQECSVYFTIISEADQNNKMCQRCREMNLFNQENKNVTTTNERNGKESRTII